MKNIKSKQKNRLKINIMLRYTYNIMNPINVIQRMD